jgi:hypothetical protein
MVDLENPREAFEKLHFRHDNSKYRHGTLPGTFQHKQDQNTFWFKYGIEREGTKTRVSDSGNKMIEEEDKELEEYLIAVIGGEYLVIEDANKDPLEEMIDVLQHNFADGMSFTPDDFQDSELREIQARCHLIRAATEPRSEGTPAYTSASDRDIEVTDWWDNYGNEPLASIKVITTGSREARVGFKQDGKVILYRRGITAEEQIKILSFLAGEYFPDIIQTSTQSGFGQFGSAADDD